MRKSVAKADNPQLGDWSQWAIENDLDNMTFFEQALSVMENKFGVGNGGVMAIGLVGSRDMPGTILRRAQSVLRWDRRPSPWSHAFLISKPRLRLRSTPIFEVPLHARNGDFPKPAENGLNKSSLGVYNDVDVDANVAIITVAQRTKSGNKAALKNLESDDLNAVNRAARDPNVDRLRYDLWESLCAWNQYLWSDQEGVNPLREGVPVPSSAYVEMAYEAMGLDLVPGASERNSAPEHIWNAARWWHQEHVKEQEAEDADVPFVMTGCYAIRDAGGSMVD